MLKAKTISRKKISELLVACEKYLGARILLAEEIGISKSYLCRIIIGVNKPNKKVLKYLGYEEVTMYRKVEE